MSLALPSPSGMKEAQERIAGQVIRSPLVPLGGEAGGNRIYLKLENLQPGGSFKKRAAANSLLALDEVARAAGVYTVSAGNFGLGLAIAARSIGCPVKVFAPAKAAMKKITAQSSANWSREFLCRVGERQLRGARSTRR